MNNDNRKKIESFNKIVITKILLLILFSMALSLSIMWRKDLSIETVIGTALLIALLLILLYKDLMRFRPTIYRNYSIMLLIGILLLGNILIGLGFNYILESSTIWLGNIDPQLPIYAIPLATGSMLAALLVDIHTAIVFSVITSLLAGIWLGSRYILFSVLPRDLLLHSAL